MRQDPYDRMANEFRMQLACGTASVDGWARASCRGLDGCSARPCASAVLPAMAAVRSAWGLALHLQRMLLARLRPNSFSALA